MNKQETITKFGNAVANMSKVLEALPENISVHFTNLDGLFLNSCTYAEMLVALHEIRHNIGTGYKLESYFLSHAETNGKYGECLCVSYKFPEIERINVYFYVTDHVAALQLIGKGKCKIKEEVKEERVEVVPASTSRRISCDL